MPKVETPKGRPEVSPGWSEARHERCVTLGIKAQNTRNPKGVALPKERASCPNHWPRSSSISCTKNREPWLKDKTIRTELFAYNASILSSRMDCPVILIDGVEDHVHILCLLSRKFPIMDVIKKSKTETSKWLKRKSSELEGFQWQAGYGIFSVSQSR